MGLLSNANTNPKTSKQLKKRKIEGVILHLTPDKLADGKRTVCAWSTQGCRDMCLNTAGRSQVTGKLEATNLGMYMVHRSRMSKTMRWLDERNMFLRELKRELDLLAMRALKKGYKAVARLNGTSDIPWETHIDMKQYRIQFYDYTKSLKRIQTWLRGEMPENYYLIYSRSELTSDRTIRMICAKRGNVAVVFKNELPKTYLGIKVINGDKHDFRFVDRRGVIVGLKAKGRAKKDTSGFVV